MAKKLKLNLRHRRHSAKLTPHKHTSYGALWLVLMVFALSLAIMTGVESSKALTLTESGAVNVGGLVKGPPPTTPAIINQPTAEQSISTSLITVRGTCGAGLLVKIFRNDVFAGSMICLGDSTFSVMVQLTPGSNILRARNYDFADQAGPDSPDVTVYYSHLAGSGSNSSSATPAIPSSGSSQQASEKADEQFVVTTEKAFMGQTIGNEIAWKYAIIGGTPPYALLVNWGDGQQDLKSYTKGGEILLRHKYAKAGIYKISLKVTDTTGRETYLETTAVIQNAGLFGMNSKIFPDTDQVDYFYFAWWVFLVLGLIILSFWLGEKHELYWLKKHRFLK